MISSDEKVTCSCDIKREKGVLCDSSCVNRKILIEEGAVMTMIRESLGPVFSGNCEDVGDCEMHGTWIVEEGECVKVGSEYESKVLGTQLDQLKGRSLTERGKHIARGCSFWSVFDVEDCIFICCIRKEVGSGIVVTKMHCMQCRFGSERRWRHEVNCRVHAAEGEDVNINENGDLMEGPTELDDEGS